MKLSARLLLLFLILPPLELFLLLRFHDATSTWATVALVVGTGVLGSYLAKREGLSAWRRLKARLDAGQLPGEEALDGVIILLAGALLVTPGVLTDVAGLLGLLPPTRRLLRRVLLKRIKKAEPGGWLSALSGADFAPSEPQREPDAVWRGEGREVPNHVQESPEPLARGE